MRDLVRLVLVEPVLGDELGQKPAVDAPRHVVPCGDREIGARVVVEADGVVEAGGLRRELAEAAHAAGAVEEPPGRPEPQARIVAGERRELAAVGALVEREQDQREVRLVAEAIEQRLQRAHIVGAGRNVGAHVAAEALEERRVVIAEGARMDLHDEPVVEAHPRHLGQHLAAKGLRFVGRKIAAQDVVEQRRRVVIREVRRARRRVPVIGGGRTEALEVVPALAVRFQIAAPGQRIALGDVAEPFDVVLKTVRIRIDDGIRPIGRNDAAVPARTPGSPGAMRAGRAGCRSSR